MTNKSAILSEIRNIKKELRLSTKDLREFTGKPCSQMNDSQLEVLIELLELMLRKQQLQVMQESIESDYARMIQELEDKGCKVVWPFGKRGER